MVNKVNELLSRRGSPFNSGVVWIVGIGFFIYAVHYYLQHIGIGWDFPIGTGSHDFRQTQTGLSAYTIANGGPRLFYEIPVLGPPWQLPFEFPIYQWLVAAYYHWTGESLGVSGRTISVAMFMASLAPMSFILAKLRVTFVQRLLILGLWMLSPLYIMYSWSVMIESTALFLCLVYLVCAIQAIDRGGFSWLLLATALGCLAAVTKITTFFAFGIIAGLWLAHWMVTSLAHREPGWVFLRTVLRGVLIGIVPVGVAFFWSELADGVRAQNQLADNFLLTEQLSRWIYGDLAMKTDRGMWRALTDRTISVTMGGWAVTIILIGISVFMRYRLWLVGACLGLAYLVPTVFTNVHMVHDYYAYANALFLVVGCGLGIAALLERKQLGASLLAFLLVWMTARSMQTEYTKGYAVGQRSFRGDLVEIEHLFAARQESENSLLFIWGAEWSSAIPLFAKRRAVMIRTHTPGVDSPQWKELTSKVAGYPISGLVFCHHISLDKQFVQSRAAYFNIEPSVTAQIGACAYYLDPASATTTAQATK